MKYLEIKKSEKKEEKPKQVLIEETTQTSEKEYQKPIAIEEAFDTDYHYHSQVTTKQVVNIRNQIMSLKQTNQIHAKTLKRA